MAVESDVLRSHGRQVIKSPAMRIATLSVAATAIIQTLLGFAWIE